MSNGFTLERILFCTRTGCGYTIRPIPEVENANIEYYDPGDDDIIVVGPATEIYYSFLSLSIYMDIHDEKDTLSQMSIVGIVSCIEYIWNACRPNKDNETDRVPLWLSDAESDLLEKAMRRYAAFL